MPIQHRLSLLSRTAARGESLPGSGARLDRATIRPRALKTPTTLSPGLYHRIAPDFRKHEVG